MTSIFSLPPDFQMNMSCVQREVKKRAKKARTVSLYSLLGWDHMPLLGVKPQLPPPEQNNLTI